MISDPTVHLHLLSFVLSNAILIVILYYDYVPVKNKGF